MHSKFLLLEQKCDITNSTTGKVEINGIVRLARGETRSFEANVQIEKIAFNGDHGQCHHSAQIKTTTTIYITEGGMHGLLKFSWGSGTKDVAYFGQNGLIVRGDIKINNKTNADVEILGLPKIPANRTADFGSPGRSAEIHQITYNKDKITKTDVTKVVVGSDITIMPADGVGLKLTWQGSETLFKDVKKNLH